MLSQTCAKLCKITVGKQPYSFKHDDGAAWMRFYTRLDSELKVYSTRSAVSSFVSYVFRFPERVSLFAAQNYRQLRYPLSKRRRRRSPSVADAQRRRRSPKDPIKITFANFTKRKPSELVSFHSLNRAISSPAHDFSPRRLEFLSFGMWIFPAKETTFISHFYVIAISYCH